MYIILVNIHTYVCSCLCKCAHVNNLKQYKRSVSLTRGRLQLALTSWKLAAYVPTEQVSSYMCAYILLSENNNKNKYSYKQCFCCSFRCTLCVHKFFVVFKPTHTYVHMYFISIHMLYLVKVFAFKHTKSVLCFTRAVASI